MIKQIISKPLTVLTIFVILSLVGIFLTLDIPVDLLPEMSPPYVSVVTRYPSAGPLEMESEVTEVLEEQLRNLEGLSKITSTSSEGRSSILLEFSWDESEADFADETKNKIDQMTTSLPDGAIDPLVRKFDPNSKPVMELSIQGDRNQEELTRIAEEIVKPRIEQVNNIAKVDVTGNREMIVKVSLYQDRLDAYGFSSTQIARVLGSQNLDLSAGSFSQKDIDLLITTTGSYTSIDQIKNTILKTIPSGQKAIKVLLSDIADVSYQLEDEESRVLVNGKQGINLLAYKQSGSNTIEVAEGVTGVVEDIMKELPDGVELIVLTDSSKIINQSMTQVFEAAILGIVCSVFVLLFFLRQMKSTLIVAISIPVSILITLAGMSLAGKTLNLVALTGLTLGVGMIVDASIVILENIFRYRQQGVPIKAAALFGTKEMITPIFASILTTICVFLPIVLFKDSLEMMGNLMGDLAFTVIMALVSSLLVAVLLVPVLSGHYLVIHVRGEKKIKNPLFRWIDETIEKGLNALDKGYEKALGGALKNRILVVITALMLLVFSLMQFPKLGMNLMPAPASESVVINVELPVGSSLNATKEVLDQLEFLIVENIEGYTDLSQTAGSPTKREGSITLLLPDLDDRTTSPETIQAKLRNVAAIIPDISYSVTESASVGGGKNMGGGSDVTIQLNGQDLDLLYSTAEEIESMIALKVPSIIDTGLDMDEGLPQLEIVIDRYKAYDLGLDTQSIAYEIRTQLTGVEATTFTNDGGNTYDVIVRLRDEDVKSVHDLERIFVTNKAGTKIPLSSIASLVENDSPVTINHSDTIRTITIGSTIAPGASANFVDKEVKKMIGENITVPEGISISYGGELDDISTTAYGLMMILILAAILVFGVMVSQFESLKAPFIVFASMPMLAVGVIGIYLIMGTEFSMISFIGVIMLVGIVVNNGIVLVDYIALLRKRGSSLTEACLYGGVSRLRPIWMTSLTTILAMVPLAFFSGEGGAMMQPLGITVVGGLAFNTITTLFLVPVLYHIFYRKAGRLQVDCSPESRTTGARTEERSQMHPKEDGNEKN